MDLAHKKARNLTKNLAILVFLFAKLYINELDHVSQLQPYGENISAMC